MMKDLDPWTMEPGGTSLIEASAGTGKTYTLTTLYVRLLVEKNLSPRDILVVTYTQAATAELRERIRQRIQQTIAAGEAAQAGEAGEATEGGGIEPELLRLAMLAGELAAERGGLDPLRRALQDFDEAAIFTIHGFCQRTLQENAFDSGMAFDAELIEEPELFDRTMVHDLWASLLEHEPPDFVEWLWSGKGKRWHFDPQGLKNKLLRELGADESMPVRPGPEERPGATDLAKLGEVVSVQAEEWAKAWQAEGDAAGRWLLESKSFKGRLYGAATITKTWLPALDALASEILGAAAAEGGAGTQFDLPDCFERLGPAFMSNHLKPDKTLPGLACFELADGFREALQTLEAARDARAVELRVRFVEGVRTAAHKRRAELHQLYFDDLLSELRAALRPPAGDRLADLLRARYRFALIDEFQDTDPVQYEIFSRVWHRPDSPGGDAGLVLIGDPKQAIYSFRGADVFTYLAARDDAGDARYALGVNWRSDPAVISAVNALFGGARDAFGVEAIDFEPVRPRKGAVGALSAPGRSQAGLRILMTERATAIGLDGDSSSKRLAARFGRTHLMRAFASDVAGLLESGALIEERPISPSDIAVLCRTKAEIAAAKRALEALDIPCVDRGDSDVFESREAWELATVLHAMLRSGDPKRLRAALATGAHGLGAARIIALTDDSPELTEISERYAEYGRIWSVSGWSRAFEAWRRGEGVTQTLLALVDGERRHTNWLHLAELLQRLASDRSMSRASLVAWLERAIASPDVRADLGKEASLLRLERDDEAVSLLTLHRSKGLEFEIVYLPALWESSLPKALQTTQEKKEAALQAGKPSEPLPVRFHDPATGARTLDVGSPDHLESYGRCRQEVISEELRLLYVGLTRAKRQCTIMWGAIGAGYGTTPLASLVDPSNRDARDVAFEGGPGDWSDENWWAAFEAVAEEADDGAIEIELANFDPRPRWAPARVSQRELVFEEPRRHLGRPVRTTSFSALVRDAYRTVLAGPMLTGRDVDAEGTLEADEGPAPEGDLAAGMDAFPRGAQAGTLLHEVLEEVDFSAFADGSVGSQSTGEAEQAVRSLARRALMSNDLDPTHEDQILHVVRSVARTPLGSDPDAFRLADVGPGQLRPEVEFTLAAAGIEDGAAFGPEALAQILGTAEAGSPLACYADRVASMGWQALNGYLRGFIDAVFCDGQRYYLIDYKSNHLGPRQLDYMPEQLVQPMIDHDYVLQYLIYSVALDRHLARRLDGYEYERHFGGAYYLFLRGLAETHEPGCGVFFDRPEASIVRGVSRLMGDARTEAA